MQAGVTDNVPLHVLGGNIIPVALGQDFMTTTAVRNATLALVVALPKENSTASGEPHAPADPPSCACCLLACAGTPPRAQRNASAPFRLGLAAHYHLAVPLRKGRSSRQREPQLHVRAGRAGAQAVLCCAADRCGGRCGGAPQAGVQNACGHMYLDQGEEMNLERSLNNYITMASQVVAQVRPAFFKPLSRRRRAVSRSKVAFRVAEQRECHSREFAG